MEKTQHPQLVPSKLFFRYEIPQTNYFFSLNWEQNVLVIKQFRKHPSKDEQIKIVPDYEEWADFWEELSVIEVWGWCELYEVKCTDACVVGDEWELYIKFKDEHVESYGYNSYPPTFREFIKVVEELTGIVVEFIHQE